MIIAIEVSHPLNSLAAIGPKADFLIKDQSFNHVYSPYDKLMGIQGSILLLIGVNFTSATPIHYAEELAGRKLFKSWAYLENGKVEECSIGSCSKGFENFSPHVQEIKTELSVGSSRWNKYDFRIFIELITSLIRTNTSITKCDDSDCIRCRDAALGGPTRINT